MSVDQKIEVNPPSESSLWAYGEVLPWWQRRSLLGFVIGGGIAFVLLVIVLIGVFRTIAFPAPTLTYVTTPARLQAFLQEMNTQDLPTAWSSALAHGGSTPILLVARMDGTSWHYGVIMPRFGAPDVARKRGFVAVMGDAVQDEGEERVSFGGLLFRGLRLIGREGYGDAQLETVVGVPGALHYRVDDKKILTDIAFHVDGSFTPRDGDVSLFLPALGEQRQQVLDSLPLPAFVKRDTLEEVHLRFSTSSLVEAAYLRYAEPFSTDVVSGFLAGFGVTSRRLIQLPDGTNATELTSSVTSTEQSVMSPQGWELRTHGQVLEYTRAGAAPLNEYHGTCQMNAVAARLSPFMVDSFFRGIGLRSVGTLRSYWVVGEGEDGVLTACRE